MIRRLLFLGALTFLAVVIPKAHARRENGKQKDQDAKATWDSEGGTPAPDPVDTPVAV